MSKYQIKVNSNGGWEIHAAGCADLSKNGLNGAPHFWDAPENDSPTAALSIDIMHNYGFELGEENPETGETCNTHDDVIDRYEGRVMPCCHKGPKKAKPVSPDTCPGSGKPFANLSSCRLYLPCPVCGRAYGTGRGVVPHHKTKKG